MIPEVGTTCLFTFSPKFATLNGIFRIRAETTFVDALASGIDFVAHLYTPAGLQLSDFLVDKASYANDRVTVLESVVDTSVVYYTPESLFATIPDPTVREYQKLIGVINFGVFSNTQAIYLLLDQIKDLVKAAVGTTDPLYVVSNPQNKIYLTDAQYATLQAARAANIQVLTPLNVQLKQEQDKNTILAAKVAYYEALIAQASGA